MTRRITTVLIALTLAGHAWAITLVEGGQPAATIVVPDEPLPVETFAANELRHHIQRSTGADLPIVTEAEAPPGALVYIGACEANPAYAGDTPNGYRAAVDGDTMRLFGDDTDGAAAWILHGNRTRVGTLFAVHYLLDEHFGVRWLWPGELGEHVPQRETIQLDDMDVTGAPAFVHARWRDGGAYMGGTSGWADPGARSRFLTEQGTWLRRHRFALGVNMDMKHAFHDWYEKRGEEEPGLFNLLPDGTRRSDPNYHGGSPKLISMCVSQPAFIQAIIEDWQATRSPGNAYIDASENDTPGKCTCDNCMAMDAEDPELDSPWAERLDRAKQAFAANEADWVNHLGSASDRYARFYLDVLAEAEKVDPDAVVMGFAYANYVNPPVGTQLNERIIIGIVPPMYFPWTDEKRAANRAQWQGWADTGAKLLLRPNWMLDGHNMPMIVARKLGDDFRFHAQNGMIGTDFDSLTGQYATQGPNLYVLARLHARPDLSVDQVLGEYYSAFGPAAAEVREYFDHWAAICDAVTEPPEGMHWSFFYREADKVFTPEAIATGEALLIRAMAAAAGDELAARRVAYFESGFTNAQMTLATQQAYRAYRAGNGVGGFRAAIGALDAHRAATEGELGANMCYLHWAEQRTWDRELLRLMENPGERIEDPWKFAWDPDTAGEDEGWWREEYDDAEWLAISTDGTWEEQVPGKQWRAETGRDYDGFAWYRRAFEIEADDTRPIVRLVFGAVDEACVVWLNDEKLLERPFPYQGNIESWQEAFEVDITDAARLGGTNSLAVRVEDNAGAGGIWRPVWIVRSPRAATEEANLLTNGDFENGDEGWGKSIMTGGFALEIDGAGHTGTNCARVECSALGSAEDEARLRQKAWGRWYQTGLKVTEGASYRLSLWAKTSKDFTGNLAIWVTGTEEGTMTGGMLDTEGMWREVTIEGIKPVGDEVGVYLNLMDGVGTAWFDGVELVEE